MIDFLLNIKYIFMTSQSEINQTQSLPFLCVLVIQSPMTYELVVFFSKEIRSHLSFTVLKQFIFSLIYILNFTTIVFSSVTA